MSANKTKDKRDIYFRRAKQEGWRARSAFKLLQIDEQFAILDNVTRVVDLCAAPGSWSQVLQQRVAGIGMDGEPLATRSAHAASAAIVAVDLQPMAALRGVTQLIGDITREETAREIVAQFGDNERAELVVCDGAPDVTGMHDIDQFIQSQLVLAALKIALSVMQTGATFVAKIFRGRDAPLLFAQLRRYFARVTCVKPKSSRISSLEAFVLCQGYFGEAKPAAERAADVAFVLCGDLTAPDSDTNYAVAKDYKSLAPVQPPTKPPYAEVLFAEKSEKSKIPQKTSK